MTIQIMSHKYKNGKILIFKIIFEEHYLESTGRVEYSTGRKVVLCQFKKNHMIIQIRIEQRCYSRDLTIRVIKWLGFFDEKIYMSESTRLEFPCRLHGLLGILCELAATTSNYRLNVSERSYIFSLLVFSSRIRLTFSGKAKHTLQHLVLSESNLSRRYSFF